MQRYLDPQSTPPAATRYRVVTAPRAVTEAPLSPAAVAALASYEAPAAAEPVRAQVRIPRAVR